ncbi:SMI1/KNR4 family protein [Tsukamurella pseudospumae]|uniref:Knr4/Smi1-like domain-containing protein n=1 Tax=Tsukamurella pseudospumae TaxID=239498 RepID=A0A137YS93_9ACTN|nr:SMI1/KNR4 family protein [Tsukamurella pseudospumae]KXO88874.1 hypothetical protein AXK61_09470 [Tsukamurella pseudospumae]
MNTDVGVARWRELIDAFVVQQERLVRIHPDLYEMTRPNPGATEEQLLAAEERLGHPIPNQYREFLTVANGWKDWSQSNTLLSCDEIGAGVLSADEFSVMIAGDPREWHGYDEWTQITRAQDSYWTAYLLMRDSQGEPAGSVHLWPGDAITGSFENYLVDELATLTEWLDREELGPWGRVWGGDSTPPTMQAIVAKYAELRREIEAMAVDGTIAGQPNPPATQESIDALESRLGHPLHPEHAELLLTADGWPGIPYLLSTHEIIDGSRWRASLVERDNRDRQALSEKERAFAQFGVSVPPAPDRPSAGEVAAASGVTPFAAWGPCAIGVDPVDGFVRWLPFDSKYGDDPSDITTRSAGTVRAYLLDEIDQLNTRVEGLRSVRGGPSDT